MTTILIVEDDRSIRDALRRSLADRGHVVSVAATGMSGLEATLKEQPEVVLLDLGLPDMEGLTLIAMIRAAVPVPILVITAQDDDPTLVRALDAGADDYVVKPFGSEQIEARIRAVLRRTVGEQVPDVHVVGHLSWLRRKLGESAAHPVYLHSVRGVGVRLVEPRAEPDVGPSGDGT